MESKVYIVIPAYNESKVISSVVKNIQKEGFENIIVVDDGSRDGTYDSVVCYDDIICLQHLINRGKGAATVTGIEAAKELQADIIVTLDGDGQHDPKDIKKMIVPILNDECDVVLGARRINKEGMPLIKVFYNKIGNLITWLFFGLWVSDSQSGFRAYSSKAANLIDTRGDDYVYESEVIREIKRHRLRYKEIPINVFYTDHSMGKEKKQGFIQGIKTALRIIWHSIS